MNECKFCNITKNNNRENTIIYETNNFYIVPSLGSFIPNYLLVVSKKHMYSMGELSDLQFEEYLKLLRKFRKIYLDKFKRHPIIFEHSSSNIDNNSASSIIHAHSHIVDYQFKDEKTLINELNFKKISIDDLRGIKESYIFYINNKNECYISIDYPKISQLLRKKIAEDIGIDYEYDWKIFPNNDNVILTIENFKDIKNYYY